MRQNPQDYVLLDRLSELGEVDPVAAQAGAGASWKGRARRMRAM